ncbi:MAG: RidA family protein [bacterium]|nr:RidA family protein [bacterium]
MKIVKTKNAPQAIGPYSQAIISGGFVFCSGQIALRSDGSLADFGVEAQTKQVMENLNAVLIEAGSSLDKVVKTTIFLSDINDFASVNEIYGSYFKGENKPARATVEVSNLPKNVKVEIDCIAEL